MQKGCIINLGVGQIHVQINTPNLPSFSLHCRFCVLNTGLLSIFYPKTKSKTIIL